tara:strand:+ start:8069 stop:9421 length:1353 start_codon:yes stop_codon:yes gene_type:complete
MTKTVEEYIKESLQDSKVFKAAHRRREVRKFLDYYAGDNTQQYIEDKFKIAAFKEHPPSNFNITKRFINRMSRIYTLGANRNVNATYDKLTYVKNYKMKHIEKMTRLIGTIATRITMEEYNGELYFDYHPVYYFDPIFHEDPYHPIAITYPILTAPEDLAKVADLQYAYWDDTRYVKYDENGKILEEIEHGLGVLPFCFTHREHQLTEFISPGAFDIVNCNEDINIIMTEAGLGMRFQMFGQAVISGFYSDDKIMRAGSDETIVLPEGSTYTYATTQTNVLQAIELIKSKLDLCAQNNHLYVQFAQDGGETPSGIALKIKDLERFEDYQDDIELWKIYEHKLYEKEKALASQFGISLPNKLKLDFNEPEYPMTVQDQIALDSFHLEKNLITEAGLMVKYNQDLTIEEAQKIINENKKVNGEGKEEKQGPVFSRLRGKLEKTERPDQDKTA